MSAVSGAVNSFATNMEAPSNMMQQVKLNVPDLFRQAFAAGQFPKGRFYYYREIGRCDKEKVWPHQ